MIYFDVVYIMYCKDLEGRTIHKVGISSDVKKRINSMQSGNPFKIKVLKLFKTPNASKVEKLIHKELRESRLTGEWFYLESESQKEKLKNFIEWLTPYEINFIENQNAKQKLTEILELES